MKILIVTNKFPYETPMALRIRSFCKLFKSLKCDVVVFCDTTTIPDAKEVEYFDGVKVYNGELGYVGLKKIRLWKDFSNKLDKVICTENPNVIFSNSMYDRFWETIKVTRKRNVPVILESSECYDPSTFRHGAIDHSYLFHCINWKYYYPKVNGVIAISRYLYSHYKKLGIESIRIPTIMDTDNITWNSDVKDIGTIHLLFAGKLARTKDSIKPFIEAFKYTNNYKKIILVICGENEKTIEEHIGVELYQKYYKQLEIKGTVPQTEINKEYYNADFGIFFRPKQISSQAGFSTKLGEGMSIGTPFIINDTGDISLYIKSGYNGFLVNSPSEIAKTYDNIIRMSKDERTNMRIAAHNTAEKYFNYRNYIEKVDKLLQTVVRNTN